NTRALFWVAPSKRLYDLFVKIDKVADPAQVVRIAAEYNIHFLPPPGEAVPVLIAGGGIGGLTLALMLHQKGIDCQVLEAAADTKPLGVGINALPHSIRELAALDLLPRLDAIGIRTRQLTYANHLG